MRSRCGAPRDGFSHMLYLPLFSWCLTLVVSQWPRLCVDGVKVAVRLGALGVVNPKIGWIWKVFPQGVKRRIPQLCRGISCRRVDYTPDVGSCASGGVRG